MPGVFDRLQKQIEDKQSEGGITALDLADLPPALRKIMRLMLRELQLGYSEITSAVASFPESERLAHSDLDEALDTLTRQAWLLRIGEGERAIYKVNLRRKSGSTLASGVWNTLDAKLKDKPE
ncbi:MAG TPA: hypothetical protein VLX61_06140 [Anaerolineales bacterium]|nr:hypothetical protein [Anaerolineales bacterium]